MIQVYGYTNYRVLLRELTDARKASSIGAFRYSVLAYAIGVQPTYLSRAFKEEAHLSADQVELACEQLELNDAETTYVQLLAEWEKAGLQKRKEKLSKQIRAIQDEARDTKNHLRAPSVDLEQQLAFQEYFLDPFAPLVHVFLSISIYQNQPEEICKFLRISRKYLKRILNNLERLGLIKFELKGNRYLLLKDHLHLDKSSPLNLAYQTLMRTVSSEHVTRVESDRKHQYTVTFGATEEILKSIYDDFNIFIKRVEEKVLNAKSEGVFQLNFDLFRWDAVIGDHAALRRNLQKTESPQINRVEV